MGLLSLLLCVRLRWESCCMQGKADECVCVCKKARIMYVMRISVQTSRNQGSSLSKLVDYKYNQLQDRE